MDGNRLNTLVRRGFAKAARHVSLPYWLYQQVTEVLPATLLGPTKEILASFSPKADFEFLSGPTVKDNIQSCLTDCTTLKHGDYLRGDSGTFFVSQVGHLTAPICVLCNHQFKLLRPSAPEGFGAIAYRATVAQEEVVIADLPGSLMRSSRGGAHESGLPGSPPAPEFIALWPDLARIYQPLYPALVSQGWRAEDWIIRSSDVLEDDLGRRWSISAAELSDAGWRLWCRLLATG